MLTIVIRENYVIRSFIVCGLQSIMRVTKSGGDVQGGENMYRILVDKSRGGLLCIGNESLGSMEGRTSLDQPSDYLFLGKNSASWTRNICAEISYVNT
jgi:hypothetical protein